MNSHKGVTLSLNLYNKPFCHLDVDGTAYLTLVKTIRGTEIESVFISKMIPVNSNLNQVQNLFYTSSGHGEK